MNMDICAGCLSRHFLWIRSKGLGSLKDGSQWVRTRARLSCCGTRDGFGPGALAAGCRGLGCSRYLKIRVGPFG